MSLYGRILARWWLLILSGTIIATAVGIVIDYRSTLVASAPSYQATSFVQVNCTAPGCSYVNVSQTQADNQLLPHIHDAGASLTNARIPGPPCSGLTDFIDPNNNQINVQATASTPANSEACANNGANYLAGLQDSRITSQAGLVIRSYETLASRDRANWLGYVRRITLTPRKKISVRGRLHALADSWQNLYQQALTTIDGFKYAPLPPATVLRAAYALKTTGKPLSPIKTVLPAAIIGLVLSFLLATLIESRRSPASVLVAPQEAVVPAAFAEPGMVVAAQPLAPDTTMAPTLTEADRSSDTMLALAEPMRQTAELVSRLIDSGHPSIYVTSPTRDEPKSESSIGLAVSLALSGKRIVLVDADPAAPISHFLGMTDRPGLSDFLAYPQGAIQQLVYPADLGAGNGSLWILPYGLRRPNPSPLGFASGQEPGERSWSQVLSQLSASGMLTIVDGPCVLESPSLVEASSSTGGVVVALQKERTGPDVTQTYDALRAKGARLLGVIANPTLLRLPLTGTLFQSESGAALSAADRRPDGPSVAGMMTSETSATSVQRQ